MLLCCHSSNITNYYDPLLCFSPSPQSTSMFYSHLLLRTGILFRFCIYHTLFSLTHYYFCFPSYDLYNLKSFSSALHLKHEVPLWDLSVIDFAKVFSLWLSNRTKPCLVIHIKVRNISKIWPVQIRHAAFFHPNKQERISHVMNQ